MKVGKADTTPADATFAVEAELERLTERQRALLYDRGRATDPAVEAAVRETIADVRARGDTALRELARRFDGASLESLEVPREAWERALAGLDADVRAALETAAANIAAFHRAQLPAPMEIETAPGVRLGRRPDPLRRVGVYAPGGRAAYPSSVLMGVVPAKVAGVAEVIVCSPPAADGSPPPAVLAACALAGADRVFALGGAGAVAALALGTESVPRADKVVGPGNAYVTEAKRQLTGAIAIDSPAGPSEVLVLADKTADPTLLAVELLAQAEHDPDAASVLVATSAATAAAVRAEVQRLLPEQPRAAIIRAALAARGALLIAPDTAAAVGFAAEWAPEHLLIATREPRALLPAVRSAGTVFLGLTSSVAFGDYITGANHVLPTAGLARAYSGLSTQDFLRWTTYQEIGAEAAAALAPATAALAAAEGLPAHGLAAQMRAEGASGPVARTPPGARLRPAVPLRAAYRDVAIYDPGRVPSDVDLSDNTNLFGPAPSVRRTLRDIADDGITRYPEVYAAGLKRALARMLDVDPANITTGCGSDDVIDAAVRAFCDPGAVLAYPDPTFGMISGFARMNAVRPVPVPLGPGFALDADALLARQGQVTYLCRPNNPTGTAFDRAATERVCRDAAGLVLVDEAYADFADDDLASFAAMSDRTVVLRTLSKAYGMAGLRVGYTVGPAPLVAEIEKARGPYKVNGPAAAAAAAIVAHDLEWVRDRVAEVRENRTRLLGALRERGVRVFDSAANFVLAAVDGPAEEWKAGLLRRGVAVRSFTRLAGAGECLRIGVGPWPLLERFLAAFDDVGAGVDGVEELGA